MEITKQMLEDEYPKAMAAADTFEKYQDMRRLEEWARNLFGEEYVYELFKKGLEYCRKN